MNHLYIVCLLFMLISSPTSHAQIGMGGQPHPAAVLDLKSPGNDKVFMPPRLTAAQRKAIVNPPAGSLVFDTDKFFMYLFDGLNWLPLSTGDPNLLSPNASRTLSDAVDQDRFGWSVAMSGDYALVGAIGKNNGQGAVYMFFRTGSTWTLQTQLVPTGGTNQFGMSVAISGNYAVVGAAANVYIFMRTGTTWTQQQQIGYSNDPSGVFTPNTYVAISGDNLVVGAPERTYSTGLTTTGKVYFYRRNGTTWPQLHTVITSSTIDDYFGTSVALSGDYAVIGAPRANGTAGAAYIYWPRTIFGNLQWIRQTTLTSGHLLEPHYNFGFSVALSGDYAVVGSLGGPTTSGFGGRVTVFNRNDATWTKQFEESSPTFNEGLGYSVAISGDYIIVGIPFKSPAGWNGLGPPYLGGAYLYKRSSTGWARTRFISETNSAPLNGVSVGIDNGMMIIGGHGYLNYQGKVIFDVVD